MYFARWLERPLVASASRNKIRLLFGARQTGKTALLSRLLGAARFFNLQEPDLRRRFEADPGAFGREVRALPRAVKHVVVDEIQKVPVLLEQIQALYDEAPSARQFFLTGSSGRELRTRSANLLPGRSHAFRIHPVCAWETELPTKLELSPARQRGRTRTGQPSAPLFPARPLNHVLRFGALPGVWRERAATAEATLATYVGTYLEEEIRREALVREMGPFSVFVKLAALESGRQINLTKLSQESGIPASTLKNYYQVLVDTFVGHWIHAYAQRARARLLTTPRFVFFDLGVRNAAAELPVDVRLLNVEGGTLLEQFVAQELIARAAYLGRGHGVSFWRTTSGLEVDFVWETRAEDMPIEVKWTGRPRPVDARHLERFLDEFPSRTRRGLLVCRCPEPQQLTDRVRAVPWDRL